MAGFCGNCGSGLKDGTKFCGNCGAAAAPAGGPPPASPPPPSPASPAYVGNAQSVAAPTVRKGMSTGAKVAIAAVLVLFIGGALAVAGVYYAVHRVSQKFHEVAARVTGSTGADAQSTGGSGNSSTAAGSDLGDPCRYLSKEEVGQAIGIDIVATKSESGACSYMARGSQTDMAAKHAAKMLGAQGADAKTQQMAEQFASAVGKFGQEKPAENSDPSGNAVVLGISVEDSPAATSEMQLNSKVLGSLGGGAGSQQDLGIGDASFITADSMIMIRKGNKIIRIMYMSCPCNSEAIKPLAKKLADAI